MKCNFVFSKKNGRGTKKSSKTWKSTLKFFWNVLCDQWPQNLKVVGPNFLQIQQTTINGSTFDFFLLSLILVIFRGYQGFEGGGLKLDQKSKRWVSHFRENWKFSKIIQNFFVSAKLLSLVKISATLERE